MVIAASIMLGWALAPVEKSNGQWAPGQRSRQGCQALSDRLKKALPEEVGTTLPIAKYHFWDRSVTVLGPGKTGPFIRNVFFAVDPGTALGVVGPSVAGKAALAKVLTGVWPLAAGKVHSDDAALDS